MAKHEGKHVCRIDYGTGTYPCVHTCEVCGGEELDQTTGRCLSCAELERADAERAAAYGEYLRTGGIV